MKQFKHTYVSGIFFPPQSSSLKYAEGVAYVQAMETHSGFWLWVEYRKVIH